MAFKIESAKGHSLCPNGKYFLDANIWITVLTAPTEPSHRIQAYLKFFDRIIKDDKSKIIVTSMLISEVINRIIRDVYFYTFAEKNGMKRDAIPKEYYKNAFRPSAEYIDAFNELTDDFRAYASRLEFVNDGFNTDIDPEIVLSNVDKHFDFNDNYFYQLALNRGYIIVTDDGDFWREDVVVVTENKKLLDRQIALSIEEFKLKKAAEEDKPIA